MRRRKKKERKKLEKEKKHDERFIKDNIIRDIRTIFKQQEENNKFL